VLTIYDSTLKLFCNVIWSRY